MKKIVKILFYIVIVFLIVYNVTIGIQKMRNPNEIPNFLGFKNFIIVSGSMVPKLNIGDIIFVKEPKEIEVNSIIAFYEKESVVTHRVIEVIEEDGKELYKTKGDANSSEDKELIAKEDVIGVYAFKIAKIGSVIMFFQTKIGIGILLGILCIMYFMPNVKWTGLLKKGKRSK